MEDTIRDHAPLRQMLLLQCSDNTIVVPPLPRAPGRRQGVARGLAKRAEVWPCFKVARTA